MAKISKPDANPVAAAILSLIIPGLGDLVINGQQKKFIMILVCYLVLWLTCCGGLIMWISGILEAYKTAEKLKAGKEIDENEYSFKVTYTVCKIIHKEAVFVE